MRNIRYAMVCCLCLSGLLFLSACFVLPVEEPVLPPPVTAVPPAFPMRTALVARGDVQLTTIAVLTHLPARRETLQFSTTGHRIRGVYISDGDEVRAGDIILQLERPYILSQLEDALRDEERTLLQLAHNNERHEFALEQAARTGIPVDDTRYLEEHAAILGRLEVIHMRVAHLREEADAMVIRAPFDGVATLPSWAIDFRGVAHSQTGEEIATISEGGQHIFRLRGQDALFIEIGAHYDVMMGGSPFVMEAIDPATEAITVPPQMGDPEPEAFFRMVGDPPLIIQTPMITIVQAEARNVTMVPNLAIHRVAERVFVHVMVDGVVTLRDIGTGTVGNAMTEVIYGLAPGDVVVL